MERTLTIRELSEEMDIGVSTIRRYQKMGMPCTLGNGRYKPNRYNAGEVAAWMKSNGLSGEIGTNADQPTELNEAIKKSILRKNTALAAKHECQLKREQMELDRARGELISRAEFEQMTIAKINAVKHGLLSIPSALATQLVGLQAPEIENRISQEVTRLLESFSKQ